MAGITPNGPSVFRFAPSPNGFLHLGHAYSALLNQDLARRVRGRLLLRLEDIDLARCRENYVEAVKEDLEWLGVAWDGPARRQSRFFPAYAAALAKLGEAGHAYPCFCTRGDIKAALAGKPDWPTDPDGVGLYPGTCRGLSPAERRSRSETVRPSYRLNMGVALAGLMDRLDWIEVGHGGAGQHVSADPARWGDALVARRDVPTSYHLSVVVDDAAQGVSDVVRGVDLYAATGLHRLLQELLGLPAPRYRHHRLVLDENGRKLSKTHDAPALRSLRASGVTAAEVRARLGFA